MAIGPLVRKAFGRHEHKVAALYRGVFIDLADFELRIAELGLSPRRVLEIGGGEGAVTEHLAALFPQAEILSIDITPRVGRLYRGPLERVTFRETTVQAIAIAQAHTFDLAILSDVLHHVPPNLREEVLAAAGQALAPGGTLLVKDWEPKGTPIHWLCHAADRFITGDRVSHLDPAAARELVVQAIPRARLASESWVRPWRNNYLMAFRC